MRSTRAVLVVLLVALIVAAVGGVILWPKGSTSQALTSEDPVTIRAPDIMPAHVGPTAAPTTTTVPATTTTAAPSTTVTTAVHAQPRPAPAPVLQTQPVPGGVSAFLQCVRWHESGNQYHAGSAGAYGILVSTWQNRTLGYSARYGTATAGAASEAAQDAAARDLFARYGPKPWSTRHLCGM